MVKLIKKLPSASLLPEILASPRPALVPLPILGLCSPREVVYDRKVSRICTIIDRHSIINPLVTTEIIYAKS